MIRAVGLALLVCLGPLGTATRPAAAGCPAIDSWPAFTDVAEQARRVVIGTVTAVATDGAVTAVRVEEILRGAAPRRLTPVTLRARPAEADVACPLTLAPDAMVGDRLALAFSGRTDGWSGRLDGAALLDAPPDHPNRSMLERLSTPQVRLLLGHEPNGSTVAAPSGTRALFEEGLIEQLLRSLPGGLFDVAFDAVAEEDE
jgi:hypothetical protein